MFGLVPFRNTPIIYKRLNVLSLFNLRSVVTIKKEMTIPKVVYFHSNDGAEVFKVTFLFVHESLNISRQFNFERRLLENVGSFLARVTTNVEKTLGKKIKKKMKKTESNDEKDGGVNIDIDVKLISRGDEIISKDAICKDIFFSNKYPPGSLSLRVMDIDYTVAVNYPWIDSIALPSSIMAGFPVYANQFEARFTNKALSKFSWMKSSSSADNLKGVSNAAAKDNQWSIVGDGFVYIPLVSDIGHKLKLECTPKNEITSGPTVECESTSVVEAGPGHCPFENRHLFTQRKTPKGSFRVVSYNILADVYSSTDQAQNELFPYCPQYALDIDYRKQLFLKELLGYNADLICLQEVDVNVFECDLVPVLGEQGLTGEFAKKSTIREGVSTFYSSSKFKKLEAQEVLLSEELQKKPYCSHILECVSKNEQLKTRITGLGTTVQAVILESLEKPGEIIVVGNTHLYFHPDADHIRLLQGGIVLSFLTDVVNNIKKNLTGRSVSLMCCGDFNSVPSCGIYKLMTTKSVPADFVDWKSKPEEEVKELALSQPFNMSSACGTPKYTNFTAGFADCLDYIYYQTDHLTVEAVVPFPSDEELRQHTAIPSVVFPSDHVAMVAEMRWKV